MKIVGKEPRTPEEDKLIKQRLERKTLERIAKQKIKEWLE